jgi:hypothetical protein
MKRPSDFPEDDVPRQPVDAIPSEERAHNLIA